MRVEKSQSVAEQIDLKNQERQLLVDMSLLPKRQAVFNSAIIICSLRETVNHFFHKVIDTSYLVVRLEIVLMCDHTDIEQLFELTETSLFCYSFWNDSIVNIK